MVIWICRRQVEVLPQMREFRGNALGDINGFAIEDVVPDEPGLGEIRVNVEAIALGFVDQLVIRGHYQVKPDLPFTPGGEIVGTIDKIGGGVRGFKAGQRVATWQFGGGLADQVLIKASRTVHVPDELQSIDAAAILLDYLTAYYALFDIGHLKPGQSLLVSGASGGVGSAAIQLAQANSSIAVGLASGDAKRRYVQAIGASTVLDYRDENWRNLLKVQYPDGIDMVFDPVGGALFELCFRSLAKRGKHLIIGFASNDGIPRLPANLPLLKSGALIGVDARYLSETDPARVRQILSILLGMAARRKIAPLIAAQFPLDDAASAFRALSDAERIGKVIVRP